MHYILETTSQVEHIGDPTDSAFINIITANNNEHPKLTRPLLVYIRPTLDTKGYIAVVEHSEGLTVSFKEIEASIKRYRKLYCLNSKYHSYFTELPLIDINYLLIEDREKPMENKGDSIVINEFYHRWEKIYREVNKLIPISKQYEYWEEVYEKIKNRLNDSDYNPFYIKCEKVYTAVEKNGLKIDITCFNKHFTPRNILDFYKNKIVYSSYNLYNTTSRPTNAFNGINFLAINKEDSSRECIIPQNNYFVEYDFDGYHLRLIAKLLNYPLPTDTPAHIYFGKQYYNKQELTEEEYAISKQITFQNMYGVVQEEYREVPFFRAVADYIDKLWKKYITDKKLLLPTGKYLYYDESMTANKVFNYLIQNLETYTNTELLEGILKLLENKKSCIGLVVYDSFLLDYSFEDGKDLLFEIKQYLKEKGYNVKIKYGKNYHSLKKSAYL